MEILKEKRIDTNPVVYWTNGREDKPALLFLHSAFGDHSCFEDQIKFFDKEYRLILPDLLGHGKSLGKGKLSDMSKWLNEILESENIFKVHIVGVSLGSVIAQDFANKYPSKVASLTSVGGYDINNFEKSYQKKNGSKQTKMMITAMFSIKKFAKMNIEISAFTKEAKEKFYQLNLKFKRSSFRHFASIKNMVNKAKSGEREHPLLIAVGEKDNELAIELSKNWNRCEPSSKMIIFKNAGHLANMDNPTAFNVALKNFLEGK